jgi:CubicO group peptidase (beta-lactamase class C family)
MTAFNGGNREIYRRFLLKNLPSRAEYIDRDWGLRMGTGGFDLKKIEEATPTTVTALLQERDSDYFARIALEVEAEEPHRILKMEMGPIERPAGFPLPHLSEPELIAELRKRVAEAAGADRFAGAVLVAKDGKPIFAQAYGLADRERNIPNTLKTRFSVGSINKMFTAVATLQLVQAGKVRLDDPLGRYLPGYPNKELAEKVTIGELLTNTGGTGDIWGPEFNKHRLELRTVQDYVTLYGKRALKFEPGSRWEYSNYGFILLGAVIEKVSGESYYDYVREHVYNPAGMTSTGSEPEEQAAADRSVGYTRIGTSHWHANTSILSDRGTPAGGGYSTVGDLLSFANALRENKLLNAHYTKLLTTAKVANPFGFDAYGFGVRTMNGTRCFGHNGASFGVNGDLELCGDSRYIVVALANMDPPAAQRISEFIMYRLPAPKPKR